MAANGFTTQNVNYHITADGGFAWTVNYDLSFLSSVFLATIRIKLIGDTASASVRTTWETGIETIWDNKVFFSDGAQLYAVQINADFVSSGQNQTVTVHDSSGRYNLTNWYTTPEGWGVAYLDEVAAHEFGHMLGNYDEYAGGATHNGFTTTGTLMSDLTVAGFYNNGYFASIEAYAEGFSGSNLAEVAATVGGSGADALNGDGGMNGFYGFGSNDTINGRAGNDYMDGGDGFDTAVFSGNRSSYTATTLANGTVRISGPDGTDTLVSIEQLQFGDMTISLADSVSINDVTISEGNSGTKVATFTVTRSGGTAAFDVNFATSDGTATVADGDFVATSNTLHFGAGENSKTISVTINGDTKLEANESFNVLLSGATNGAILSDGQGIGNISNDDVIEANGSTHFTAVGDLFFLYDGSSGAGHSLKYFGMDAVAGQFGGWAPIGAERTATGYDVAWKSGADAYTVWSTDSSGNYITNLIGAVSGTSNALQSFEPIFHQDLNIDGLIGPPTTPVVAVHESGGVDTLISTPALTVTMVVNPIEGTAGNDLLTGSDVNDMFVFAPHFGNDSIVNFQPGQDYIEIDHTIFADATTLLAHTADDVHGNAVITAVRQTRSLSTTSRPRR
jgi:hypothetical protein